jgi:hypothetical protein
LDNIKEMMSSLHTMDLVDLEPLPLTEPRAIAGDAIALISAIVTVTVLASFDAHLMTGCLADFVSLPLAKPRAIADETIAVPLICTVWPMATVLFETPFAGDWYGHELLIATDAITSASHSTMASSAAPATVTTTLQRDDAVGTEVCRT